MIFNRAVALHTFQQHHWIRVAVLGVILLFVFLTANGMEKFPLIGITPVLVWVLGTGIIGRDMSSGVSHLLFTRPITRVSYVMTKWISLVVSSWAFCLLILLVWAAGTLAYRDVPEFNQWTLTNLWVSMWMVTTLSSVVILYSCIMPGWGDLALLFFVHVTLAVMGMATSDHHISGKLVEWLLLAAWPGVSTGTRFLDDRSIKSISSPEPWEFLLFSGIAALYLLAAVLWMRRKDITYTAE